MCKKNLIITKKNRNEIYKKIPKYIKKVRIGWVCNRCGYRPQNINTVLNHNCMKAKKNFKNKVPMPYRGVN